MGHEAGMQIINGTELRNEMGGEKEMGRGKGGEMMSATEG